eukprot:m.164066 g.164066  ORF g.164066 m.164066 type:complete len:85 (-) comp53094_c0_seq44:60-314(-)
MFRVCVISAPLFVADTQDRKIICFDINSSEIVQDYDLYRSFGVLDRSDCGAWQLQSASCFWSPCFDGEVRASLYFLLLLLLGLV